MYIGNVETFIALLRGINVGGHKKIIMSDLRTSMIKVGFEGVQTYIQSGNLVFQHPEKDRTTIEKIIHELIKTEFGFEVAVLVKSRADFEFLINHNPFLRIRDVDIGLLLVGFLFVIPSPDLLKNLEKIKPSGEHIHIRDNYVFMYYPDGYGKAKMNINYLENKLKVQATARNWRTINTLLSLFGECK